MSDADTKKLVREMEKQGKTIPFFETARGTLIDLREVIFMRFEKHHGKNILIIYLRHLGNVYYFPYETHEDREMVNAMREQWKRVKIVEMA